MNDKEIVDLKDVRFKHKELRRWLKGSYRLETYEFSDELEEMDWLTYCVRYCDEMNIKDMEPYYYVCRIKYPCNHYKYTVIERLED
jgi:hypothetical protein